MRGAAARTTSSVPEPTMADAITGQRLASFLFPLCDVSPSLAGTAAVVTTREGALVVEALIPEGDAVFKAMPNARIEHLVDRALSTIALHGDDDLVDVEGRRLRVQDAIAYQPGWTGASTGPGTKARKDVVSVRRNLPLAIVGLLAAVATIVLVVYDLASSFLLLLLPAILYWSGCRILAALRSGSYPHAATAVEGWREEHLRRSRVQARLTREAVNRARGLGLPFVTDDVAAMATSS